jgi:hypothetical protein
MDQLAGQTCYTASDDSIFGEETGKNKKKICHSDI